MAFFPILIDWQDMPVLIAGGGEIARHKAELLSGYGADVTVVSSSFCEGLAGLAVRLVQKKITPESGTEELEVRVRHLLAVMKGKRFVLANSDSCPPGVSYEKFLLVSDLVRR